MVPKLLNKTYFQWHHCKLEHNRSVQISKANLDFHPGRKVSIQICNNQIILLLASSLRNVQETVLTNTREQTEKGRGLNSQDELSEIRDSHCIGFGKSSFQTGV